MSKKISKRLSYVLRHAPETIGIELEENGWVEVNRLLEQLGKNGLKVDRPTLDQVVATNEKKRFEFSDGGERIRARQGHSVEVDLGYVASEPPEILWHGTAERHLESIEKTGLNKAGRTSRSPIRKSRTDARSGASPRKGDFGGNRGVENARGWS